MDWYERSEGRRTQGKCWYEQKTREGILGQIFDPVNDEKKSTDIKINANQQYRARSHGVPFFMLVCQKRAAMLELQTSPVEVELFFLCKHFLLSQYICIDNNHMSENNLLSIFYLVLYVASPFFQMLFREVPLYKSSFGFTFLVNLTGEKKNDKIPWFRNNSFNRFNDLLYTSSSVMHR